MSQDDELTRRLKYAEKVMLGTLQRHERVLSELREARRNWERLYRERDDKLEQLKRR